MSDEFTALPSHSFDDNRVRAADAAGQLAAFLLN
jgi:hypothetical protein